MNYGWNEEKNAEVIHSQHLAGENPQEITDEFKIIQSQNQRTRRNTLSFVLSPSIEDGKELSKQELKEITKKFIKAMGLKERQAIAFVHRDKSHTHIHLYVNRIGFDGKTYNDNFIGKRSQHKAYEVAKEMGMTNARDIQYQRLDQIKEIRKEIKQLHENIMKTDRPKNFDAYIKRMKEKNVKVIPSINKQEKLQGFRFEYKGHNLKGSEVHRSMSGGKLAIQISNSTSKGMDLGKTARIKVAGKVVEFGTNIATTLAKRIVKKVIKRTINQGMEI